jgi:hypothetical protein
MNETAFAISPKKLAALIPITLIVTMLLLTPIAAAQATKTYFTGNVDGYEIPSLDTQMWINKNGNIIQTKGGMISGAFSTNYDGLTGMFTMIYDASYNPSTGRGSQHGTIIFDAVDGNVFEGRFQGLTCNGFYISGDFVADGTGNYAGLKMKGTYGGMYDPASIYPVPIPYRDGSGSVVIYIPTHVTATISGIILSHS